MQWRVLDDVATVAEIRQALDNASIEKAKRDTIARAEAAQFAAEVQHLKASPESANLVQGEDRYSGVLAAKNIRKMLKRAFPAVNFSVRKASYGSLTIEWTDGPTEKEIEEAAGSFKAVIPAGRTICTSMREPFHHAVNTRKLRVNFLIDLSRSQCFSGFCKVKL
ncbi:LPD29 domain-containing protein [Pseudomonas sp. NPDC098747]|uniref:LPD29 domain-containing protein n=1 Tax=Pseudomonas sp. NPDC098747 TaxID=3364487 RepID=UPI00383A7C35